MSADAREKKLSVKVSRRTRPPNIKNASRYTREKKALFISINREKSQIKTRLTPRTASMKAHRTHVIQYMEMQGTLACLSVGTSLIRSVQDKIVVCWGPQVHPRNRNSPLVCICLFYYSVRRVKTNL